jgi:hypothetical protein
MLESSPGDIQGHTMRFPWVGFRDRCLWAHVSDERSEWGDCLIGMEKAYLVIFSVRAMSVNLR